MTTMERIMMKSEELIRNNPHLSKEEINKAIELIVYIEKEKERKEKEKANVAYEARVAAMRAEHERFRKEVNESFERNVKQMEREIAEATERHQREMEKFRSNRDGYMDPSELNRRSAMAIEDHGRYMHQFNTMQVGQMHGWW